MADNNCKIRVELKCHSEQYIKIITIVIIILIIIHTSSYVQSLQRNRLDYW